MESLSNFILRLGGSYEQISIQISTEILSLAALSLVGCTYRRSGL